MLLPILLGAASVTAGAAGVRKAGKGIKSTAEAHKILSEAKKKHKTNQKLLKEQNDKTNADMDRLGLMQLEAVGSFSRFADIIEKIQNRPKFESSISLMNMPKCDIEKIKVASANAVVFTSTVKSAAAGTAGGVAAAGAVNVLVEGLAVASTGTPIAALSGAAATNATLAALGGGALAAGGGGMALGSLVLGLCSFGAGLLFSGIIFDVSSKKMQEDAQKIPALVEEEEKEVKALCERLEEIRLAGKEYARDFNVIYVKYRSYLVRADIIVGDKTNWKELSRSEKNDIKNLVQLAAVLYKMCSTKLVLKNDDDDMTKINDNALKEAKRFTKESYKIK